MKDVASAWAPSHATLFFSVPQRFENPLSMGSLGGGINFSEGMITKVHLSSQTRIFFNGIEIDGVVSNQVLDEFQLKTGIKPFVEVNHQTIIPTGYGLSTSGAGAISLSLALNEIFETGLSYLELLQLAHVAEVKCKTGLGSVLGQSVPGIEIRMTQGAPGIAKVLSFQAEKEIAIIPIAPLSTSDVLTSETQMQKVTEAGQKLIDRIHQDPIVTLEAVIEMGREFTFSCGLLTPRIEKLIKELDEMEETRASMAMIGETLIIYPYDLKKIQKWAINRSLPIIISQIADRSPHILQV